MRKRSVAAIGTLAMGAAVLAGCSSSNEAPGVEASPTYSPTAKTVTKTIGNYLVTLNMGGNLPEGWPLVPAPNNGTLKGSGTAVSANEPDGEQLLAAWYEAPGEESQVEAAMTKQMFAAGWEGGELSHGMLRFEHGHEYAFISVVDNGSTDNVDVYQVATEYIPTPKTD